MQYQGKQNCIKCSRWRPVIDYAYYSIYSNGGKGRKYYLLGKCKLCQKEYNKNCRRKNGQCPKSVNPKPLILEMKRLGWSNKKIAENAKVDVRRVYDWLHGKENIGLRAADNLCIATGIDLNSLIK